jgi:hypothetical protein
VIEVGLPALDRAVDGLSLFFNTRPIVFQKITTWINCKEDICRFDWMARTGNAQTFFGTVLALQLLLRFVAQEGLVYRELTR